MNVEGFILLLISGLPVVFIIGLVSSDQEKI